LLDKEDISDPPTFPHTKIKFSQVYKFKDKLFSLAFNNFNERNLVSPLRSEFDDFCESQKKWLENYSLFVAIKSKFNMEAWNSWPDELRFRKPGGLNNFKRENQSEINRHSFIQFLFYRQWKALINYAHGHQIKIIGDIPLFVAYDSSDVWSQPKLFDLTESLEPRVVAGVPPDYFSSTGQLWGNPHYLWPNHKKNNYVWWRERFEKSLEIFDIFRLDHFRGFGGYWEIKAGEPTAENGRWVRGPGAHFFKSIEKNLGELPIIAEDLGVITPDIKELAVEFGFPGMRIFQFGFSSDANDPFLPHNYTPNCVAFTGTHDNATAKGWYVDASKKEQEFCRQYLNSTGKNIPWEMIRALWASCANFVLAPMQDFLALGNEARMNFPGKLGGNWNWRMKPGSINVLLEERIRLLNIIYGRNSTKIHAKPIESDVEYQDL
jgi:4-alpha-glucanotransferase